MIMIVIMWIMKVNDNKNNEVMIMIVKLNNVDNEVNDTYACSTHSVSALW